MIEFLGPDFNFNGYCDARYRMSNTAVDLGDVQVPSRVEALNTRGEWQQFPVVFVHYITDGARQSGFGLFVMFLPGGKYSSRPYDASTDRDTYQKADSLGLTEGSRALVQSIVREEE